MLAAVAATAAEDQSSGWTAPPRAARRVNPVAPDDSSRIAGKRLFIANCAACHGKSGHGDGSGAIACNPRPSDLSDPGIASESDGELFWKITTGRKPMPGYEPRLSEPERWHVVNYLRVLAPPPPPATQPGEGEKK